MSGPIAQQILVALAAVCLLALVLHLVRRRRLAVRYGLAWAAAAIAVLILSPFLGVVPAVASLAGMTPTGVLLAVFFTFLVLACIQLSVALSRSNEQIHRVAESAALLEKRVRESEHAGRAVDEARTDGSEAPAAVLAVVPAFNEEATVVTVVTSLREHGLPVLVVDDGSADETARLARSAGASVLSLPANLGVGAALRLAFRSAVQSDYQRVVVCDADGQHLPSEIEKLMLTMEHEDCDLVIGSRFADPNVGYRAGSVRRAAMRVLAWVASREAQVRLTDSTSGFRLVRSPLLEDWSVTYPSEYLGATVEALVEAARAGYSIREVPVEMQARAGGVASAGTLASVWYFGRLFAAVTLSWPAPGGRARAAKVGRSGGARASRNRGP